MFSIKKRSYVKVPPSPGGFVHSFEGGAGAGCEGDASRNAAFDGAASCKADASDEEPSFHDAYRDDVGRATPRAFATFRQVYESRDEALCVFEDEHGHMTAVPTARLA